MGKGFVGFLIVSVSIASLAVIASTLEDTIDKGTPATAPLAVIASTLEATIDNNFAGTAVNSSMSLSKGMGKQKAAGGKQLKDNLTNTQQLEWDEANGLYWPKDTMCNTWGCRGKTGAYTLITFPENQCWFCQCFFLSPENQALMKRFQEKLINHWGGLEQEIFSMSRIAKEKQYPGKALEKGMDKGKGRDKASGFAGGGFAGGGKNKSKFDKNYGHNQQTQGTGFKGGKARTNSGVDIRTLAQGQDGQVSAASTLTAAVVARLGSVGTAENEGPASSNTGSRASSRTKKAGQAAEQQQQNGTVLEWLSKCDTLDDLVALKERIKTQGDIDFGNTGTSGAEDKPASICSQNHHVAADLSKALKNREAIFEQVRQKQHEIDSLEISYNEQVEAMRQEYKLRDCIDSEQERMIAELKEQKAISRTSSRRHRIILIMCTKNTWLSM